MANRLTRLRVCAETLPRGGTPLRTTLAGTFARRMMFIVEPIAFRSISAGLHGITANSAAFAASNAADSVCGAVSIIASVAPLSLARCNVCTNLNACVDITAGVLFSRISRQLAALACGSRSINAVVMSCLFKRYRQVNRKSGFTCATLTTQDSNRFHSIPPCVHLCACAIARIGKCAFMRVCKCAHRGDKNGSSDKYVTSPTYAPVSR